MPLTLVRLENPVGGVRDFWALPEFFFAEMTSLLAYKESLQKMVFLLRGPTKVKILGKH
jgi:hypothetical protein